eukprot:COSAG02_NODE_2683_length_8243_cov_8.088654_4_plen_82_part_00
MNFPVENRGSECGAPDSIEKVGSRPTIMKYELEMEIEENHNAQGCSGFRERGCDLHDTSHLMNSHNPCSAVDSIESRETLR